MAYLNETEAYHLAAKAVLAGIESGVLKVAGQSSYRLSEAARAHADLEAGVTSGALYLKP
jgi:NADPH2:quinone reductase